MVFNEILSLMETRLLAFGRKRIGREWNYCGVNSYYSRLILVLKGSVVVTHHGRTYDLVEGSLHLIPCYITSDYVCDENSELYYLHFTSRTLGGLDVCGMQEYNFQRAAREIDYSFFEQLHRLNPDRELPVVDPSINLYRRYHDQLQKSYSDMPSSLYLENRAYISLILAPFLASGSLVDTNRTEGRRLYAFMAYVEKNLHRSLELKEIAEALSVSPNYLSDWLFNILHIRPSEYINRRRIEEAQQLLVATQKSIKEIAYQVGFSSPAYFARVFRRQLGISASRYRACYI